MTTVIAGSIKIQHSADWDMLALAGSSLRRPLNRFPKGTLKVYNVYNVSSIWRGKSMRIVGCLFAFTLLLCGCVQSPYQLGAFIPGRIVSLADGKILPMQIQLSYGSGKMTAVDPVTGETFDGTYTAIQETKASQVSQPGLFGDNEVGSSVTVTNMSQASAILVGSKGTVLNIKMQIQAGRPPIGFGEATDNAGKKYNVQF